MSNGQIYGPDYLRSQADKQLHLIADTMEINLDELKLLRNKLLWYEAPENVKWTVRNYMELSPGNKIKIDNLMEALLALRTPDETAEK